MKLTRFVDNLKINVTTLSRYLIHK